jgi:hypothetical protein
MNCRAAQQLNHDRGLVVHNDPSQVGSLPPCRVKRYLFLIPEPLQRISNVFCVSLPILPRCFVLMTLVYDVETCLTHSRLPNSSPRGPAMFDVYLAPSGPSWRLFRLLWLFCSTAWKVRGHCQTQRRTSTALE